MAWVNAYKVTRHFGGHEEGGWWYNNLDCIESVQCSSKQKAEETKVKLESKHKGSVWGNIYSMAGGAEIEVFIEKEEAESETRYRPQYE